MDWTTELLGYAAAAMTVLGTIGLLRWSPRFRCQDCDRWLGSHGHDYCRG